MKDFTRRLEKLERQTRANEPYTDTRTDDEWAEIITGRPGTLAADLTDDERHKLCLKKISEYARARPDEFQARWEAILKKIHADAEDADAGEE